MELIRHSLFTDWSTMLIYASAFLIVAFLSINFVIWMLDKLPVPPGRRSRGGGHQDLTKAREESRAQR